MVSNNIIIMKLQQIFPSFVCTVQLWLTTSGKLFTKVSWPWILNRMHIIGYIFYLVTIKSIKQYIMHVAVHWVIITKHKFLSEMNLYLQHKFIKETFNLGLRCLQSCKCRLQPLLLAGNIDQTFNILTEPNEREEFMQETQHTQQTATRKAQNQDKKTAWM